MSDARAETKSQGSFWARVAVDLKGRLLQPIPLVIWLSVSLVMSVIGPFNTYGTATYPVLFVYWGLTVGWATLLSLSIASVSRVLFNGPSVAGTLLTAFVFVLIYTPTLILMTEFILSPDPARRPTGAVFFFSVAVITLAIGFLVYHIETRLLAPQSQRKEARIWRRLPDVERAPIIRLTSDGHFVDIHTTRGTHRLRIRFADAVDELDGIEGACVHRSHWVAKSGVVACHIKKNRPFLMMTDGAEIPVSKTYQHEAEALGVLDVKGKPALSAVS